MALGLQKCGTRERQTRKLIARQLPHNAQRTTRPAHGVDASADSSVRMLLQPP